MVVEKACPIVLRERGGRTEILAFRHPSAGCQIVKGTVETGETPADAAVREMFEESGVRVTAERDLGTLDQSDIGQRWHLHLCSSGDLPESWQHRTKDDGGHLFIFFWHPLDRAPDDPWHPIFRRVLGFVGRITSDSKSIGE